MQTLIELKTVTPATVIPQQDTTACDTSMPQHVTTKKEAENKEYLNKLVDENVAVPQHQTTADHIPTLRHTTLQNVATPQSKKRGLFGRVLNAVFNED
jgi:hypothetical protein